MLRSRNCPDVWCAQLLTPVAVAHDVGFSSVSEPLPDAPADPGRPAASAAILEDVPEALAPQLRAQFSATFSVLRTVFGRYQSILRSEGCARSLRPECWRLWFAVDSPACLCRKLDFDDLLVYGVQLLEAVPAVATVISSSCQHLLVDEFQDTNELQYRIVRGMTRVHGNVFVVGDPFQARCFACMCVCFQVVSLICLRSASTRGDLRHLKT